MSIDHFEWPIRHILRFNFDKALPLPIFFRFWFSTSKEHFYDERFDSPWFWWRKTAQNRSDTISLVIHLCDIGYVDTLTNPPFIITFMMEFSNFRLNFDRIAVFSEPYRTCISIYFGKRFRNILWCILGGHREWIFTRRSFLTAV